MKRFSLTKFAAGSLLAIWAMGCSDDAITDPGLPDASAPDAGEPGTGNGEKDAGEPGTGNGEKDAGDPGTDNGEKDAGDPGTDNGEEDAGDKPSDGDAAAPGDAGPILTDAGANDASTAVTDGGSDLPDGGGTVPDDGGVSADAGDSGTTVGGECIGGSRESGDFLQCLTMVACGDLYGRCIAYNGRFRGDVFNATLGCHAAAPASADPCSADSLAAIENCATEAQAAACVDPVPDCVAVEARCGAVTASRCEQDLAPVNGDVLDAVIDCFTATAGDAGADCESEWLTCLDPLPE